MVRLYARLLKGKQRKFVAVDWKQGTRVRNLIYATIFTEAEGKKVLEEANRLNGDVFEFELRKVDNYG